MTSQFTLAAMTVKTVLTYKQKIDFCKTTVNNLK